ncbi:psbP domain-containing protein 7, chloroplastic [Cornus florida]|uniref:psbP domain-containing protein 7, chloroplastic n=1 Tax=Cornus florida TaxID=4283 RepID=UPI002899B4AD|nr:psbP domain-containing protein 7, chloroplastic [Cornus florida]
MAMQHYLHACKPKSLHRICMTQPSGDQKDSPQGVTIPPGRSPADQFAPLASVFRRRLLTGVGSASVLALGANFAGITSFLLGLSPETGQNLKLDVLYPIAGYRRCVETNEGFEFVYPARWFGDRTLLIRAARKAEFERSLDPSSLNNASDQRRRNINEPIVAFGPPKSSGELNVSVIVSPVPLDFSIEAFGGPKEVGEAVVQTITGLSRLPDVKGTLIKSTLREDSMRSIKYYELEFRVESSSFRRHNVAVCCARRGRLFTLNAQAPETAWPDVKSDFYRMAGSFTLTS